MAAKVTTGRTAELIVNKYNADIKRRFVVYVDGKRMNTYPLSYDAIHRHFETYKKQCEKGERSHVEIVELVEEVKWA